MKFITSTDLLYRIYTMCKKNDKKTKTTWCCGDFNTDLDLLQNRLDNKESFQIMVRPTGFESEDRRIESFKSFLRPDTDYKIYNISYRKDGYHLIAARS